MKKFLFLFLFFIDCSVVFCQERIGVVIPSEEQQQVEDLLGRLKSAVCNEDPKTYLSCFTKDLSSKIKKRVVLQFMKHDMEMEIDKFEILDSDDSFVEFVAKYSVYEDSDIRNIVSSVQAKKIEGEGLFISKEEIISDNVLSKKKPNGFDLALMPRQQMEIQIGPRNCENGKCDLHPQKVAPKKFNQNGAEVLEGVVMFNDAEGNPSPNGIMWLDPKKLLQKFPDKYGVPPCARGQCPK